jgi:hypothetical protein
LATVDPAASAQTRKQRISGGTTTRPELLTMWQSADR